MTKIVWRSRSRCISFDHCFGTVKATKTMMIVRITISPASVKPDSDLEVAVRLAIEGLSHGLALHVEDAGPEVGVFRIRVRRLVRVRGIVLHLLPIGLF